LGTSPTLPTSSWYAAEAALLQPTYRSKQAAIIKLTPS